MRCARSRLRTRRTAAGDGFRLNIDLVGQQIGGAQYWRTGVLEVSGLHVDVSEPSRRAPRRNFDPSESRLRYWMIASPYFVGHALIALFTNTRLAVSGLDEHHPR